MGEYDFQTRQLRFVNAGHNPPILCWEDARHSELLEAGTTILGAFEELPFLEIGRRENLQNFTIHLYTDGLTESMNPEDEEFGEDRFRSFVDDHSGINPEEFHQKFLKLMGEFSANVPLNDDLTLLSLRFD